MPKFKIIQLKVNFTIANLLNIIILILILFTNKISILWEGLDQTKSPTFPLPNKKFCVDWFNFNFPKFLIPSYLIND